MLALGVLMLAAGMALVVLTVEPIWHVGWPVPALGGLLALAGVVLVAGATRLRILWLEAERDEVRRGEVEARRQADTDPLTGLGNYRVFWRTLGAEVARARRHGSAFSLVVLDLDGFKRANDELGHQAGDRVLAAVADALRGELREEDVCCRQGGDEFAVIAVGAASDVEGMARRLVDAVGRVEPEGLGRALGASAGWATYGHPATTADHLLTLADDAMRKAKREGGGVAAAVEPSRGLASPHDPFDAIASLARDLAGRRDPAEIARATVERLVPALGAAWVVVARRGDGGDLETVAAAGEPDGALTGGEPRVVRDALARGRVAVGDSNGRPAELAVPVAAPDSARMLLVAAAPPDGSFGKTEGALAESAAAEMSRALAGAPAFAALAAADELGDVHRVAAGLEPGQRRWDVAQLAWGVGRKLGMGPDALRSLYLAALLHDVGLLGVPLAVLRTPGPLGERQLDALRSHPRVGETVLRDLPLVREAAEIVRHEHERPDGSGYPDGIAGDEIPLASRVLLACSTWVALGAERPWRKARGAAEAEAELRRVAGAQLDPRVVEALLRVVLGAGAAAPVASAATSA